MLVGIRNWAQSLKRDTYAVYLVARSPETPWYVKALALIVAAYALSPIDLIPDFIPVVGYLDDLIIVPLGILLVIALLPEHATADFRAKADQLMQRPQDSKIAAVVIIAIWVSSALMMGWLIVSRWAR
jgi:uncharacterized membrane protein YkvA (DUF1232 family)